MEWSTVSKIKHTSNGVSRICPTCKTEKVVIAAEAKDLLLNKRQDLLIFVLTTDNSTLDNSVYLCTYLFYNIFIYNHKH